MNDYTFIAAATINHYTVVIGIQNWELLFITIQRSLTSFLSPAPRINENIFYYSMRGVVKIIIDLIVLKTWSPDRPSSPSNVFICTHFLFDWTTTTFFPKSFFISLTLRKGISVCHNIWEMFKHETLRVLLVLSTNLIVQCTLGLYNFQTVKLLILSYCFVVFFSFFVNHVCWNACTLYCWMKKLCKNICLKHQGKILC